MVRAIRTALDCRSDILTYTSAPLDRELHLAGTVTVEVYCQAEQPSFDLCAVMSTVDLEGKVTNFTQGYIRVDTVEPIAEPVTISLQATCICIAQNYSLRLSLSAACFPAYPVNSGTGKLPNQARAIDNQIITLIIYSGADYPSQIKLPTCN